MGRSIRWVGRIAMVCLVAVIGGFLGDIVSVLQIVGFGFGFVVSQGVLDYVHTRFRTRGPIDVPWYAHPRALPDVVDQVAWQRAVEEVSAVTSERVPRDLPGQNTFLCEGCGSEPTTRRLCGLCDDGD